MHDDGQFGEDVATSYDDDPMFDPAVVGPTVEEIISPPEPMDLTATEVLRPACSVVRG